MGYEIAILDDLLNMPAKSRAALLVSALDALQRPGVKEIVHDVSRAFPDIARPQLLQQSLLMLMACARAGTTTAAHALYPTAECSHQALDNHLGEAAFLAVDPFATALWGLIESLFPEDQDVPPHGTKPDGLHTPLDCE